MAENRLDYILDIDNELANQDTFPTEWRHANFALLRNETNRLKILYPTGQYAFYELKVNSTSNCY